MASNEVLQAFVQAATQGSFSAAARKLGKSQSTVSAAVASLEIDLDVVLFDRSSRKPTLTPAGHVLLERAEQVLALWCVWMAFDGKRRYSEREVNEVINLRHAFGDHCLLRRELVQADLLARTPGGEQYRKLPARPSDEAAALLRAVRRRAQG